MARHGNLREIDVPDETIAEEIRIRSERRMIVHMRPELEMFENQIASFCIELRHEPGEVIRIDRYRDHALTGETIEQSHIALVVFNPRWTAGMHRVIARVAVEASLNAGDMVAVLND